MFARFRDDNFFLPSSALPPAAQLRTGDADLVAGAADVRKLRLADGRMLTWTEFGHRHGYPLIYFHSQAGSRLEAGLLHNAALAAGFRLIAIDRPGIGQSDFSVLKRHGDFSADVGVLISHLNLLKPGLIAWAGGAPFALAFAAQGEVDISFVSVLAPTQARFPNKTKSSRTQGGNSESVARRILLGLARGIVQLRQRWAGRDVDQYLQRLRDRVCHADRLQLDNPWVRDLLQRDAQEAKRQGTCGIAQDTVMVLRDWGFDPAAVKVPVHVWHGGADTLTPLRCAHSLVQLLPRGVLHTVRRQGHFFFTWSAQDIFRVARQELRSINGTSLNGIGLNGISLAGQKIPAHSLCVQARSVHARSIQVASA